MLTFRSFVVSLLWLNLLIIPIPVLATLGEDFSPALIKKTHQLSALRVNPQNKYTVNEYAVEAGTLVREFVGPTGKVFAVIWKGPYIPDLRQLLGVHFNDYAATAAQLSRPGRHPLMLRNSQLVINAGGHLHAFSGLVYLPDQMPEGVSEDELQ
ncbi:MAG: DUF2844 domain-containing protein [Methylococcales bacterium]|nr:MAG: DUF2844 domain-containing protein [Methylococcales bacterium]